MSEVPKNHRRSDEKTARQPSVSEIAQIAFVSLLKAEQIPDEYLMRLDRAARMPFQIEQGDRYGVFHLGDYKLLLGTEKCVVDIHANTTNGRETFPLGFNAEGQPNFRITYLAEIPDAAGPI